MIYESELAICRVQALRTLYHVMTNAPDWGERRRAAVAILDAPDSFESDQPAIAPTTAARQPPSPSDEADADSEREDDHPLLSTTPPTDQSQFPETSPGVEARTALSDRPANSPSSPSPAAASHVRALSGTAQRRSCTIPGG